MAADLARGGMRLTYSGACASGLIALIRAAMMIEAGEAERVLVVAAEASVHPLFLATFKRLGVLARPGDGCKPFDRARTGFLMSEAAAAVCLEARRGDAASGGLKIAIDRYAFAGDAKHLTAGDPNGRVLRHLINKVNPVGGVDLVHAHGTGTVANDPVELAAIESELGQGGIDTPCLYSHKGALGHSLGASGLVSVVLNVLAHRRGQVPGNVRTTEPLPTGRVLIGRTAVGRPIRRSIALASGFGGATAAVSLKTL
jgi:3-oxoacyl-(acyl-carrier-protein) synthase